MQEHNLTIEILITDDASTDGTDKRYTIYYKDAAETKCICRKTRNEFLMDKSPLVIFGAGQIAAQYIDDK